MNVELSQDDVQNIINAYDKDIKKMEQQEKEIDRLNNITKNQDRKIKLAIKIFENINKIYGESSSINDVIGVLKEE